MTRNSLAFTFGSASIFALVAGVVACDAHSHGHAPPVMAGLERGHRARARGEVVEQAAMQSAYSGNAPMLEAAAGPAPQSLSAGVPQARMPEREFNTEQYDHAEETGFRLAKEQPLSTFSVDVDTASYSNVRRFLAMGQRPPIDAVRIEELINYFDYDSPAAANDTPIAVATELAQSPFAAEHALLRIGLRASAPRAGRQPAKRLVFLIDVSGSMQDAEKLPLLKSALGLLVPQLGERDEVAIVTYAGESGVALPRTRGDDHETILDAIDRLEAGGSTNGGAGIALAYDMARASCVRGANCRVILATDGDFNVGVSDRGSLVRLVQRQRDAGVFLTVLGFGMGNLKDATMEELADKGDGSYAYIDTLREAKKVLVEQASATLRTVAKDTKIQVEWNPARVARYRLLGYENRRLHDEDFNDDAKDAGEMGDGQQVTALYELELYDPDHPAAPQIDPLRYQAPRGASAAAQSDELVTVKVRWKSPEGGASQLLTAVARGGSQPFARASNDLRFASAVAGFGMLLRTSPYAGKLGFGDVERMAREALGADRDGYRHEFLELIAQARGLD